MSGVNEQDVLDQLASFGLDVTGKYEIGKPCRCHWSGEDRRNNKGWFWLNEKVFDDGNVYVIGGYGVWHGDDNNRQSVKINGDYKPSKQDQAMMRQNLADQRKQAAAQAKRKQAKAAEEAARRWRDLSVDMPTTDSDELNYQQRKQIKAYGVRYDLIGMIAVPVADVSGKKHGLQWIMDRKNPLHRPEIDRLNGTDKQFWPKGMAISGNFHLLGVPDQRGTILLAEGYATAASLHEASGLPVAVTFNANNIAPVLKNLKGYYKRARFLIAADDDYLCRCSVCKKQTPVAIDGKIAPCQHCGEAHKKNNTGIRCATNACADVRGAAWFIPQFTARDGRKITDFNDLHVEEGLNAVASQVDAAIALKFPDLGDSDASPARGAQTGGAGKALQPLITVDDACERYSLVYGIKDLMFDHQEGELVPKSCVMDLMPDHGWREWKTRSDRKVVRLSEVGFDPPGTDKTIKCNSFLKWPTVPSNAGLCDKLLAILEDMCSGEGRAVFMWVLCWLAYPIQHPGAKMRTALVFHGPQGAGKNIFFEAIKAIYGKYGFIIGQDALEDTFTDWLSAKLYLIANEVVARQELFHTKNRIKGLITEDTIRIRAPYVKSMWEKNHANLVFLSNETQPLVLEKDDRRFMVVWTPAAKDDAYYRAAAKERDDGGIAALHDYLLNLDLGDFNEHSKPLMTSSKSDLIELGRDSVERFYNYWADVAAGERKPADSAAVDVELVEGGLAICPVLSNDLYVVYLKWCNVNGVPKATPPHHMLAKIKKMPGVQNERKRYRLEGFDSDKQMMGTFIFPPGHTERPLEISNDILWLSPCVRVFRKEADAWNGGDLAWRAR